MGSESVKRQRHGIRRKIWQAEGEEMKVSNVIVAIWRRLGEAAHQAWRNGRRKKKNGAEAASAA